ncbi:MAG: hypothetical protein CSA39_06780 [Flavobacteriales bacterium]|nr:MAG: hypothetical protein CSA39_06780 [Flavobacteriales bacterium]
MSKDRTDAQPPEKLTGIKLKKIPTSSAGLPALSSSIKHIARETGFIKGIKLISKLNQKKGFDCPGCAWPDPDDKRAFMSEYCENGIKAVTEEATRKKVTPEFFKNNPISELVKLSDYELGKLGRITHPVICRENSDYYEEIDYMDAIEFVYKELITLDKPDEAIFYTSGRTSNEAAFMYQLYAKQFGTNNLPDCSNMCHESSGVALSETLGIGKGSVTLDDFYKTELIIVIGQNPGTNHPRMLSTLKKSKKNGAKIITINPLPEAGLMNFKDPKNPIKWLKGDKLTDVFLPIKINEDVALLKVIMKRLFDLNQKNKDVIDHAFIAEKTAGYDTFLKDLNKHDMAALIKKTGLTAENIEEAVQLIAKKKKIIICWAMGLTQHKNAVDNIREIVNLLLLKGSIGKPGAGTCPVRGHSNVQGDRTVGIWEKPPQQFLDSIEREFNFKPPQKHGYDTLEAIEAMYQGKAEIFIGMGGNFISATPDTEYTAKALQKCVLTVQISTKLNRSHLIHGKTAIIIPCLTRSEIDLKRTGPEQFVTVENSMGVVHKSQGHLKPISKELRSEVAIVCDLGTRSFRKNSPFVWYHYKYNYDLIRDKIEATIPGFENYNKRVRKPGGFYLPNGARRGDFSSTTTGKANFTINRLSDIKLKKKQLIMMTIRTHDQYNTTIYGLNDRYRGVFNERRVIFMNKKDMEEQGLEVLDAVDIISHFQGEKRIARKFLVVPYPIPIKNTATYFPEANVLVALKNKADYSNTPASKTVIITVRKR